MIENKEGDQPNIDPGGSTSDTGGLGSYGFFRHINPITNY
jgi:hypothetical protein